MFDGLEVNAKITTTKIVEYNKFKKREE